MRIAIDLDNTVIDYGKAISRLALQEYGLEISSKNELKCYLAKNFSEDEWTMAQGKLYGEYIQLAESYPEVLNVLRALRDRHEINIEITSHKTRYPVMGQPINLREKAEAWLRHHQIVPPLISRVVFFETKAEKIDYVNRFDVVIDDLVDILDFCDDAASKKIHFNSECRGACDHICIASWGSLLKHVITS